jgi:hypothetical protein
MSACIIPVAPEFQDPPSQPDPGLMVFGFDPAVGAVEVLPVTPQGQPSFLARVSDGNVNDYIYVLWTVDYNSSEPDMVPPYQVRPPPIPPPLPGQMLNQPLEQSFFCPLPWTPSPTTTSHVLELIVANRPLLTSPTLDTIDDPSGTGSVIHGFWTFVINCPVVTQ